MTRPMLDFLIRLHKNGDNPYDNEVRFFLFVTFVHFLKKKLRIGFQEHGKKRDARYRIRDNYLLVDVKVPQDGQYGLDIFAREKWEDQMVHCCKYLINCDV